MALRHKSQRACVCFYFAQLIFRKNEIRNQLSRELIFCSSNNQIRQIMSITKPIQSANWGRIEVSLRQRFRREPTARSNIPMAMDHLKKIAATVGEKGKGSRGRRVLRNMGIALAVSGGRIKILSCICLSIPPGEIKKAEVSSLVQKHVTFLESLGDALPPWELVCLFPPPERDDIGADAYIREVCYLTGEHYRLDSRVSCELMTSYAPGIIAMEEIIIDEIATSSYLSNLCEGFLRQRSGYYASLRIEPRLWLRKNRRTMAQYIILGRLAALHGCLMCIHTTVNIHCAIYGGAGVLHNPVGFR